MKKIILLFTSILLVCLSAFGLTACEGCTEEHTHSFVNQVTTGDFLKDQATCESRAVYYYSCSCGEKGTDTFYYGEVGTHSYYLGSCKWCGEPETQNPDEPVHTHNFNKQVVEDEYLKSPATCTDKATYYYSCECGEKGGDFFETGSPLDHAYGDFSSNGDGTHSKVCANDNTHVVTEDCSGGVATETSKPICSTCGGEYGATLSHTHSFTQQVVLGKYMASSATCLSPALCYYSCECGKAGEETFEVGSKTGHSYGAWTIEDQATCDEDGEKYRKCVWCEDTVTSVIPATGHNVKETQRQNATCEESGYVKYECDKCDYFREVIIQAGEHSISITDSKVANCTEDGYIKYECANCDYERVETVEGGHVYQVIAEKQANKTEDGYVEYKCVNCTDKYREETPALGDGKYVLLVQDSIPWTTDNAVGVLKKLTQDGYINGYSITTASNFNNVDLAIYSVIYVSNDQTTSTYNTLATLNDEFTEFVEDGGILIYGACDNGWSGGDITYSLPGGVTRYSYYSLNNYIVDFEHEIVTGAYTDGEGITNDLLQGTYCSHSGFIKNTLPEDTRIILEDGQGLPTLIEYGIGDGYVIASGLTWEFYYTRPFVGNTTYSKNVFDDLIVYAVNLFDACDHVLEQGEIVAPNCEDRGYTEYHCSVCGATIKKNYTDKLGHDYLVVDMDENKAGVQHIDAGDGFNFIVTLKCQKEECQKQIQVTTTVVTTVEANCGRQGYTTFKYTYSDGIEEKTQTFNERFVDISNPAVHVIEDGINGVAKDQTIKYDSKNRTWIDQVISQGLVRIDSEEINCTSSVEAVFTCKFCNQMISFTIEGNHDFVDDTLNDELPTCVTMGKDYATCSVCGQTELISVTEANRHEYQVDKQGFEEWKLLDDDGKANTALRFECDCGDWFEAYWARRVEVEGNPCAGVGSYYYEFEHPYTVEIEGGQTMIVTFRWSGLSATFTHTASNESHSLLIQPGQILEYTNVIESLVNSNTIRLNYGGSNSCIESQVAAAECSVCGELFVFYLYGKHEFKEGSCGVCGKPDPDYVVDTGLEYYLVNDEYYVLVGRGNYQGNEIFVPSTYNGKPVREINSSAFRADGQVQIVQIQNGIELIGAYAFSECENLSVVKIDSEVNCFGYNAFAYCPNIEEVHFSGSIDQWVQIEFASADANPISSGVASLYIDGVVVETAVLTSATKIAHGVFYQYQKLESITISESVKSIDSFAFTNCYKLKEVNYNGSIENWAKINFFHPDSNPTFYTNDLLINGYLVNQIELSATEKISPYAFYNCKSVDRVKITEGVANIGDSAFRGCSSLSTLILGENVTRIENGAFFDCASLTNVFYCGTEVQKEAISINYNDSILSKNWYFYSQNEPKENNKYWHYVGEVPTIWVVEEKPQADLYFRNGNTVYFGSYPQTKVTDTSTLSALGGNSAPANTSTWTNYNYYVSGVQTDCMYYKDVSYNGEKYRGVYLKAYRPFWTTTANTDRTTLQDDSGYYSSNVYWFKYEPIEWEIVEEANGVATLVSKLALDAQQIDFRSDQTYRNNYAESSIRAWLNDNFYNTAFSSLQQAIIQTTTVDNSASTTQSDTNAYACANTNDKVYLLSYKEASEYCPTTEKKAKYSTDYAKSQGVYVKSSNDYQGTCFWWTRSPDAKYNYASTYVDTQDGFWNTNVYSVQGGVVPVVKIAISSENSEVLYTREEDTIYFGSYPQTKVTNTATITALGGSNAPASTSDWVNYNYYVNGVQTDCMYYKDVIYNGEKYRGVYIKQYRPYYITNPSSSNYQDDNGYNFSKVYWFKYEPIEWEIVEELNGKATLVCKMILDSQNFDFYRENSYVFNYAESAIRRWLNVDFYNTAFSEFEKLIIQTTSVDNSADSTGTENNSFACDNTNDKVYILSYIEAITYYTSKEERFKKTTDYAQSQGAATYIDSNSIYHGNGLWWLRSPDYDGACLPISYDGYLSNNGVDSTREGVVPAIQIAL